MQKHFAYRITLSAVDLIKPYIFDGQKNKGEMHNCKIRTENAMTAYSSLIFVLFWASVCAERKMNLGKCFVS